MKHLTLTGLLISILSLSTKAQPGTLPTKGPGFYFTSFQSHYNKNADSSLYFIRLLAANPNYTTTFQNLLHDNFAQTFQPMWEREITDSIGKIGLNTRVVIGYKILDGMMSDTNQNLVKSAKPIYYWTKILQSQNDNKKLIALTNEFIATELSANDIYQNRVGRYALLIHQVISQKPELKNLAQQLFTTTVTKLELNQVDIHLDTASRQLLTKRTWYRYLYAYCNYLQANKLLEKGSKKEADKYFKTAFDFSPDATDRNNTSAYFYDMYFLLEEEKRTFANDYVDFLMKNSDDKKKTLSTLVSLALANPAYKEKLQSFYNTHYSNQEAFNGFWIESINKISKNASSISLKKSDGNIFSTTSNKGKWILMDFWGTWCAPCIKEHPDLQKFYQSTSTSNAGKFVIITVACKDNIEKVNAYMTQHKYSFPVAMADNAIENTYNIKSYPSKILITPQGKYLIIPFGVDWVDYIKKYAGL